MQNVSLNTIISILLLVFGLVFLIFALVNIVSFKKSKNNLKNPEDFESLGRYISKNLVKISLLFSLFIIFIFFAIILTAYEINK
ncbi:MAG: hypothetical protein RR549_06480 [Oscillospiraceae bacterium]